MYQNRPSSETWVRRNMTNMSVPWPPKGWRKPRKSMNRTWSTGPKSFPTHTTLTEVKRLWFYKQVSIIERRIIIFPFFWPHMKMREPYRILLSNFLFDFYTCSWTFLFFQMRLKLHVWRQLRKMTSSCFSRYMHIQITCLSLFMTWIFKKYAWT